MYHQKKGWKTVKYSESGVNIDKGMESVSRIKKLVKNTYSDAVLSDIGSFGAMYNGSFDGYSNPVLVSSADGVGTKLIVAEQTGYYENCGADIVNHSVNDILAVGAKPLYFLDYIGCGIVDPDIVEGIITSMAKACRQNSMSLIGGELAEMSITYDNRHYDIVGFITGIVEREKIINGSAIETGDIIIGLPSNGFHTNGFSLVRKIISDNSIDIQKKYGNMDDVLYRELLKAHRSYLKEISPLLDKGMINGIAHITGGGFYDNIARILPENKKAVIEKDSFPVPELFRFFVEQGKIDEREAYRVFNMGIGIVAVIPQRYIDNVKSILEDINAQHYIIGRIEDGSGVDIVSRR